MGKGPKRDRKTGRFTAKRSIFQRTKRDKTHRNAAPRTRSLAKKNGAKMAFVDENVITYQTKTVNVKGVKYKIPVDDKGKVPRSAIAARFLAVNEGTGKAKKRNPVIDQKQDAKIILPSELTPEEIKGWWAAPNTMDVDGIDDANTTLFTPIGLLSKGAKEAHGKIAVDGTPEQIKKIRSTIANSFTVKEQKALVKKGGITVHVVDLPGDNAAIYKGKSNGMSYQIFVDPKYIDDDSFLHEVVHHSRMVDDGRSGILIKSRSSNDQTVRILTDDVALEEAATILETLARCSPYTPTIDVSYHALVANGKTKKEWEKDARDKIEQDRELVAGSASPGSKGLRGKRAKDSVEKNFDRSNISNLIIAKRSPKSAKQRLRELASKHK